MCELLMGSDTREQCLAAAAAGDVKFFSKFPNHFITRHNIESRAAERLQPLVITHTRTREHESQITKLLLPSNCLTEIIVYCL